MLRTTRLRLLALAAAAATGTAVGAPSLASTSAQPKPKPVRFSAPVRLTPDNAGGYEPSLFVDRYGNLFSTAHKENAELAASPDSRSATGTRSRSWAWYSADGGATWKDLPFGPGDLRNHELGDEGDMALDDAGNLYFVDTNVTDINFTSWQVGGRGKVTMTYDSPLAGFAQPLDDRPWVAAHGNGHVFYFGNEGDKLTYPLGNQNAGPGTGPGRYTVYRSTDGGRTWDHRGITLKDSGWCRPAAAPHSSYVYALCTDDAGANDQTTNTGDPKHQVGTIYSYVSADDGLTWKRYPITHFNPRNAFYDFPSFTVARDGSLWGLYLDGRTPGCTGGDPVDGYQCDPTTARFLVMHSTDRGAHWTTYDAAPAGAQGSYQYRYGALAVAPDSKTVGVAVYGRPYNPKATSQPAFKIYAAVAKAGQRLSLVSVDDAHPVTPADASSAPGDFLMDVFDAAGRLHLVWTRVAQSVSTPAAGASVLRYIFTAQAS